MDMDLLAAKVSELAGFVWNGLLLYLLVGTGIIFTIRTRFIQVRKFGAGFRRLFGSVNLNGEKAGKEGMSSFQAVATSIAAQVGTGNITGCATAMISGGPGAIFWMWLAAFFGMATIYGEAVLAQTFKTKDETGHVIGGPVYYIRQAFKGTFGKILAGFFALAIIFALGFTGNMVQSNAISNAFQEALGIPTWIVGVGGRLHLPGRRHPHCLRYGEAGACHGLLLSGGRPRHADCQYYQPASRLCPDF